MSSSSSYIKSFFEKGRIVFNERKHDLNYNKKLFKSVLIKLHVDHPAFIEECTKEKILYIDHKNLIIELVL